MFAEVNIGAIIWAFLNSPVGMALVMGFLAWILGKLWASKPEWEKYYNTYKGAFFSAVKWAEQHIDDDAEGAAATKADAALKYLLKIQPGLSKYKEESLREAITKAHTDIEEKGKNI